MTSAAPAASTTAPLEDAAAAVDAAVEAPAAHVVDAAPAVDVVDATVAPEASVPARPRSPAPNAGPVRPAAPGTSAAPSAGGSAAGRAAFDRACGRCHPNGEEDVGPRLRGIQWDEARMRRQVRSGGGTMRPIAPSRLSDGDLDATVAYLRTLRAVR